MKRRDPIELLVALWEYDPTQYDPEQFDEGVSPLVGAILMIAITLLIALALVVVM
jgi:hypothetical protein